MKKIEKYFEGKISYKAIDDFVDKTRAALDPDDNLAESLESSTLYTFCK